MKVKKKIIFISLVLIFGILPFFAKKNIFLFSNDVLGEDYLNKRINVLILGHRGEKAIAGGILTDSIMVFSLLPQQKKGALISIPRDLYVEIPESGWWKINHAYVYGKKRGSGLDLPKKVVSEITGLEIHYAVAFDIEAVKEIVDILGGIDIYEEEPFYGEFYGHKVSLKKGWNHLNGSETLAYIGVRNFKEGDFKRIEHQQKAAIAIKEKIEKEGLLKRPDKILKIYLSLHSHIDTDLPLSQIKNLLETFRNIKIEDIKTFEFSTSNYLRATHTRDGAYILIPQKGWRNYEDLHFVCQNIFNENILSIEDETQP